MPEFPMSSKKTQICLKQSQQKHLFQDLIEHPIRCKGVLMTTLRKGRFDDIFAVTTRVIRSFQQSLQHFLYLQQHPLLLHPLETIIESLEIEVFITPPKCILWLHHFQPKKQQLPVLSSPQQVGFNQGPAGRLPCYRPQKHL